MISDTIKAVKDAEAKAAEFVAHARQQASDIQKGSETDCENIIKEAQSSAKMFYDQMMEAAKAAGEETLAQAAQETLKETDALRALAGEKEAAAIDSIIAGLL